MRTNEIKNEIDEIKKWEDKIKRKYLKYETNKYMYDFQQFEMIRFFGDNIYTGESSVDEAQMDQGNLSENMVKFNNKTRPKKKNIKKKKEIFLIV